MWYFSNLTWLKCAILCISALKKIVKTNKFDPYRKGIVQELTKDDLDRQVQFCDIMTEKIAANTNYFSHICVNDETTFHFNTKFICKLICKFVVN